MKLVYQIAFVLFVAVPLLAQQVSVTASVDSQSVTIGDWICYTVDITYPKGTLVAVPSFKDTLEKFDIVRQDTLQKKEENGVIELKKNFIITRFDAGNHSVPPFIVQYKDTTGKIQTAQSNPIPVEIRGVEVDTSRSIRDLKPQLSVPISWEEIAMYALVILVLAGAGYGVFYYFRKKKGLSIIEEETVPSIPAHITALLQLDELEEKELWQRGEYKLFQSEATEILRRYFERRYGILALEMTTGEVMEQLQKFKLDKNIFLTIEKLLSEADLVKFAKYLPTATENSDVIPTGRKIIEYTKPVEPNVQQRGIKEEATANV